jgi:hypothetical protein
MLFGLLTLFLPLISADGVSLRVEGHDGICVFAQTKHRNEKVAFYYTVHGIDGSGEFGVAVHVQNTKQEAVLDVTEDTGDYVFSANAAGEYMFCFNNQDSGTKMIYVDVTVESDTFLHGGELGSEVAKPPPTTGDKQKLKEVKSQLDFKLLTLQTKVDTLHKQMQYIKMREGRSISTGIIINSYYS